ncbi:PEP/pyruvate-binding domain-containing protein [Streptomyces sp. NPDC047972]|uniref:PEP/pyruvate-binding domain-containing protein n=1 Tax=Streptomyces sp. NPDC047972 TaxID=3365493 RepID=UPI0037196122
MEPTRRAVPFNELSRSDIGRVGGKNASLGEMTNRLGAAGIRVPPGFATTAEAYEEFLAGHGLRHAVEEQIGRLHGGAPLDEVGAAIRSSFLAQPLPQPLRDAILTAYERLAEESGREAPEVAVRSSATAEDLPEASFAGQQETYLNVRGPEALLEACRRCYASLFTDRAIDYRERMGFDHLAVALSVGVQLMVRSDLAGAGVAFTLDPESGFPEVIVVSAAWGLGETVVSGQVDPDEYTVFKPGMKDPSLGRRGPRLHLRGSGQLRRRQTARGRSGGDARERRRTNGGVTMPGRFESRGPKGGRGRDDRSRTPHPPLTASEPWRHGPVGPGGGRSAPPDSPVGCCAP